MLDNKDELLEQIRLGEDTLLELKEVRFRGEKLAGPKREDLADELAAMANTQGGVIVLGVEDSSRDVVGIPLEKLDTVETWVRNILNDQIEPPLLAIVLRLRLPDNLGESRPVIKIEVPRSLFVHKSPGGYFHRVSSSKREMSTELLARLMQQRSQARILRFEEQAVPESSFGDFDERLYDRFLGRYTADPEVTLHKLKLLAKDESGTTRATVAGILMCSKAPERRFPNARIEAVRYRGVRQDTNYQIDAAHITGPLDDQIRQGVSFLRRTMRVAAVKEPGRREIPQFSERAVFEALVNAVAHRDYSIYGSKIRFFIFDDRLELYSPGALPNSVTIESLPLRQATRNELLTSLLAKCDVGDESGRLTRQFFMEKRGDGVPIILDESTKLSGREPVYRLIDETELLLTIWSVDFDKN